MCPQEDCFVLGENNNLLIIDDGHWSVEGARIVGKNMRNRADKAARILFKD